MFKSGYVNLIGEVNTGKSSLINTFIKKKILIISGRPGSTIDKILCILNNKNYQIIFSDIPGINFYIKNNIFSIKNYLLESDVLLYLVIPKYNIFINNYIKKIINYINNNNILVFLVINKIDIYSKKKIKFTENFWKKKFKKIKIFKISVKKKKNIKYLLNNIIKKLKNNIPFYNKNNIIYKSRNYIINEYIRESIFLYLRDEIPYNIKIKSYIYNIYIKKIFIYSCFFIKKKSYKKIILSNINKIYYKSLILLKYFFKKKIFLKIKIKYL
ncbi:MAG: GTPase [Candidatus Shikimatogenerans sp. Tduv]|uniref:GTPase Era n=1 Tax=Candidatus Shikimatogenerans sp. Tduv TaxID=3158567 RepID=A0AAU7QS10_9FLAO